MFGPFSLGWKTQDKPVLFLSWGKTIVNLLPTIYSNCTYICQINFAPCWPNIIKLLLLNPHWYCYLYSIFWIQTTNNGVSIIYNNDLPLLRCVILARVSKLLFLSCWRQILPANFSRGRGLLCTSYTYELTPDTCFRDSKPDSCCHTRAVFMFWKTLPPPCNLYFLWRLCFAYVFIYWFY